MNVAEKIYYTWLILDLPITLCGLLFFHDLEEKQPILFHLMCAFLCLPIVTGLIALLVYGIVQVWQG